MALLFPLILGGVGTYLAARIAHRKGLTWARHWATPSAAAAAGMGWAFVASSMHHFLSPHREGLEAIVPSWVPWPGAVVLASGVMEVALAVGLMVPRTRVAAGALAVAFLLAVFPANVEAARGVDHPDAPTTPLVPRIALQVVFLAASAAPVVAAWRSRAKRRELEAA